MPENEGEEQVASAPLKRKRGRPPKNKARVDVEQLDVALVDARDKRRQARIRHDVDEAPIDGDYDQLRLENDDPEFKYFWATARDRARLAHRGWIEEKWGPTCARPRFYFGPQLRGENVVCNELTLLKLPKKLAALIEARDPRRRQHAQLMREILQPQRQTAAGEQGLTHSMNFSEQSLQV